jgi:transposase-like protein
VKRAQAIHLLREGWTQAQVGRELGIPKGTLSKWRRAAVETGELEA